MSPTRLHYGTLATALLVLACGGRTPSAAPAPAQTSLPRPQIDSVATDAARAEVRVATGPDTAPGVEPGRFDTGKMWTFENAPLDYFQQEYGFRPTVEWLKHVRLAALRLPNCSAAFVSAEGLVMTNHHCAREGATAVSRPGEDLLDNGFYAARREDERRVPDLYVDQLVEIRDVTDEVRGATPAHLVDDAATQAREEKIAEISARVSAQTSFECSVTSLYHGGKYSLYCYRRYSDVRLVFAPEGAAGYFGGDPDNFTYPRYDLDVSFFRVYGENGQPVRPDAHLSWSARGAAEGETVFVIGNPGETNRLKTVAQLEYSRDVEYPHLVRMLASRTAILSDYMKRRPDRRDDVINDYFSLSNALKAYRGQLEGLRTPALMKRKIAFERNYRRAVMADTALRARYGRLWDEIANLRRQIRDIAPGLNGLAQGGLLRSETLSLASTLAQYGPAAASGRVPDSILAPVREEILATAIDPELDVFIMAAQLEEMRDLLGPRDPIVIAALGGRTPAEAAQAIVTGSAVVDSARRAALLAEPSRLALSDDPAIRLMRQALPRFRDASGRYQDLTNLEDSRAAKLAESLFKIYGTAIAPDATFTLRLADGVIKGYDYNGTRAPIFTTFNGMYDRHFSNPGREEWALPKRWLEPPAGFDLRTPFNQVSTNDIIGGNSGSPMVNTRGEVVGLIFDGNIESLPGDFIYTTEASRSVSVHSAGILEALRDLYRATALANELTSAPARPR